MSKTLCPEHFGEMRDEGRAADYCESAVFDCVMCDAMARERDDSIPKAGRDL